MKSLSSALETHLAGELTNLAYLIKITRVDTTVLAFTTHDRDLVVDGVTYKADGAFSPSAIESNSNLATDNLDVAGILASGEIEEDDIKHGLYDHARVDIYVCNWNDLSQGVLQLRRGWLGEVTLRGAMYAAELRGFHDLLQRRVGDFYTAECRHDLGDDSCTVDIEALKVSGTVTAVTDRAIFADNAQMDDTGYFDYGKLIWTSGANDGLAMEVKSWVLDTTQFSLWLPMPQDIEIGDTFDVYPGCDKRFSTCKNKFNNVPNFGGFPHIPGVDRILQYPDSK